MPQVAKFDPMQGNNLHAPDKTVVTGNSAMYTATDISVSFGGVSRIVETIIDLLVWVVL